MRQPIAFLNTFAHISTMQAKKQKPSALMQDKPRLAKHKPASEQNSSGFITQTQLDDDFFQKVSYGWTNDVRMLLNMGANPNARGPSSGITALMKASLQGHTDICGLLIERGADVNARAKSSDSKGVTALIGAASSGYPMICALLIEKGADIEAKDAGGRTALMYAAMKGKTEACDTLTYYGADAGAKDTLNMTAHMIAIEYKKPATADFLKRMERIQQLVGKENIHNFIFKFRECVAGGV